MRVAIVALVLTVAAAAGDPSAEELALRRTAIEAQMRIGAVLEAKGDLKGAIEAYRKAAALYKTLPKVAAPERVAAGDAAQIVAKALEWLSRHQDKDGRWDAGGFEKHDPAGDKCTGPGDALYDTGVTSLAVLAFLGAGYTDRGAAKDNPYAVNVRQGLRFLMTSQAADGVVGTRATSHFMYNHALATFALCEAYWRTRNPRYKKPAQDGLNFIAKARNPYLAWRYEVRGGDNDTSVTTWCVLALRAGKFAGLDVDPDGFTGGIGWYDKMTDAKTGRAGYNMSGGLAARPEGKQDAFPPQKTESMTAAAIFGRILCGQRPSLPIIRTGAALCANKRPVWNEANGAIDLYYWHYATHALRHVGGDAWKAWRRDLHKALLPTQRTDGAHAGSWDPVGPWGSDGGRIYATAIAALTLQVETRKDGAWGAVPVKDLAK